MGGKTMFSRNIVFRKTKEILIQVKIATTNLYLVVIKLHNFLKNERNFDLGQNCYNEFIFSRN